MSAVALVATAMLAVSGSLWGTTFGIMGDDSLGGLRSDNVTSMTNTTGNTFTWTFKAGSTTNDKWFRIYKNSEQNNDYCVYNSSVTEPAFGTEYTCTIGGYKQFQMDIINNTVYTIQIVYNSDSDCKLTVLNGGDATAVWSLRGDFNGWSESSHIFSGSASSKSVIVSLSGNTRFKVAKKSSGTDTWYGKNNATITSANRTVSNLDGGDGINITIGAKGEYTFTVSDLANAPDLTVTYPSYVTTTPVVRWGEAPYESSKNIIASAYVAKKGCYNHSAQSVTKFNLRFWKETEPETVGNIEYSTGNPYAQNSTTAITIPSTNSILLSCSEPTVIVMEVAGYNANGGWSSYSEQAKILYSAAKEFILNDLEFTGVKAFTQCDGGHQFELSSMVVPTPTNEWEDPDGWSVKIKGTDTDASDDFELTDDGYMIWKTDGKSAQTYEYTFTFNKSGYPTVGNAADLTIEFTATDPTLDISGLVASTENAKAWEVVTLTATNPGGSGIATVRWKVTPDGAFVTSTGANTASFKGAPGISGTTYTVTAYGESSDCVTTRGKDVSILVTPDSKEPECNP